MNVSTRKLTTDGRDMKKIAPVRNCLIISFSCLDSFLIIPFLQNGKGISSILFLKTFLLIEPYASLTTLGVLPVGFKIYPVPILLMCLLLSFLLW